MKKLLTKKNLITIAATIAIYALLFFLVNGGILSRHYKSLLVPIGINIILAVSLNLTTGFLGELTLGHAGFMSVGAYTGAIFTTHVQYPPLVEFTLAIIIGGTVAALFGILIGIPVLRLKGDYLAIVTLAFGEIIRSIIINLDVTGGAAGLKGIERYSTYTFAYIIIIITILAIVNLVRSRHGRAICSIRENYIAAESVGIHLTYYKIMAFVIAAFFAGMAGVLYAHNLGYLSAGDFDYNKSIEILVIVVLGGMGSIKGSIISAIIITVLPELLRGADDFRMLIYAVVLITMMLINSSDFKSRIQQIRSTRQTPKLKGE